MSGHPSSSGSAGKKRRRRNKKAKNGGEEKPAVEAAVVQAAPAVPAEMVPFVKAAEPHGFTLADVSAMVDELFSSGKDGWNEPSSVVAALLAKQVSLPYRTLMKQTACAVLGPRRAALVAPGNH